MNHFERVAIFTVIENLENQLKGLKTLIAASANEAAASTPHRVTSTLETDPQELSEEDEDKLFTELELTRQRNIEGMRKTAEAHFQKEWDLGVQGMANLDG